MRCSKCDFETPQGMNFCGQCGAALAIVCPHCEFENPANFNFCGQCAVSLSLGGFTTQSITETAKNPPFSLKSSADINQHAERRQITVLFCDVVGSSQLSELVDPEDLRDIMCAYRHTCDSVLKRYNGYIAQYLGDGVLAYYGFPTAHEQDACNAVIAAYELVQSMSILNESLLTDKGISLDIRLGIHTGLVVIGGMGDGDKRITALGDTPNIAARLQDLAKPNCIVISATTYQMVQAHIRCITLGEHVLKGFTRKFELYQVIKPMDYFHRENSNVYAELPPLIGREQESRLLLDKIQQANLGLGQVVLLSGEAGIGKSRLVQFICDGHIPQPHHLIESWGSQYYKNSYLYSICEAIKYLLDFDERHNDEQKLARIEKSFSALNIPLNENIQIIGYLLGVVVSSDKYPLLNLTPARQNQKTLELLLTIIMAMAKQRLVVLIIEDLHWFDQTTLDLIELIIARAANTRLFLLLTYRVEFSPPWPLLPHLTQITLNRLDRHQSGKIVNWAARRKTLPPELFNEILVKTDGIPFFIAELSKMIVDSKILVEFSDRFEMASPACEISIPSTLQDSLMARLDKLGPDKALAQLSATLGREFGYTLLEAIVAADNNSFEKQISNLVCAELLYQRGLPPHASYTFRHTLVQELAYHSLLKSTRQKYHRIIADTLIHKFSDKCKEHPEILAHHCYEAGDCDEAVKQLINAGKIAIQRSALVDAIVHLKNALKYLLDLPESTVHSEYELSIQRYLGLAYILYKGYAAEEVKIAYNRAHFLCQHSDNNTFLLPILSGLWEYYVVGGDIKSALNIATQLESITSDHVESTFTPEIRRIMGATLFWSGELVAATNYLQDKSIVAVPDLNQHHQIQSYCQNTEVARLANLACVTWLSGDPQTAINLSQRSVAIAEKLQQPFSVAYALHFKAIVHQLCANSDAVYNATTQLLEISDTYEFEYWRHMGRLLSIWSKLTNNLSTVEIENFADAIRQYESAGSHLAVTYFWALLSEFYIETDQLNKALTTLEDGLKQAHNSGELFFESELHRLHGLTLQKIHPNNPDTALDCFLESIQVANTQGAVALELRASVNYSGLLVTLNNADEAYKCLAMSLGKFNKNNNFPELQNAREMFLKINNEISLSGNG